jgi:transcriptional regulator with XRE-family HTH domain
MDTTAPIKKYRDHGLLIKAARVRAKLTQRNVSEITGIPLPTIKEYEQGRTMPSVERELQLMVLLGIDLLQINDLVLSQVSA